MCLLLSHPVVLSARLEQVNFLSVVRFCDLVLFIDLFVRFYRLYTTDTYTNGLGLEIWITAS